MKSSTGIFLNRLVKFFSNRYLYIHLGYWIFYLVFFTLQRYSYEGFTNFLPVLEFNIVFLPDVVILTYFVVEYLVPRIFFRDKIFVPVVLLILIVFLEPLIAYFIRIYIVEPYIYDDHIRYNLNNYLAALMIFIFGLVPLAGLKIARRLQADYLHHHQVEREKIETELKLKQSELKLLKGQIQPHFLFNTLNNIYSLSIEKSPKTPEMILRLSDMLSYVTYECTAEKINLSKEVDFINSFIELQKLRYDECNIETRTDGDYNGVQIAPMILHPFIETAFRNCSELNHENSWIRITVSLKDRLLFFSVLYNSQEEALHLTEMVKENPVDNAVKRLEIIYPQKHELKFSSSGNTFSIFLKLEL